MSVDESTRLMLGYLCIANVGEANLGVKVEILDRFDLKDAEICKICGCTLQAVRTARLRGKKKKTTTKEK